MLPSQLLALSILAPALVSAALFPPDSTVKMLNPAGFRKAMKENQTSVVAFVAPWCGHCQKMAPEYGRTALGLYPLVPMYAVDCDDQTNKRLCAEQGVTGFPTVKMFPRGKEMEPLVYDLPQRTASGFFYWVTRRIPGTNKKLYKIDQISPWVEENIDKPRALLLTKAKQVPLLWKVIANKYKDQLEFGSHRDRKGKTSVKMGMEAGEKKDSKVLIYPAGSTEPIRYQGINKLEPLSKFLDSVLDGTVDLTAINKDLEAEAENFVPDPTELEIEQKQEAQRIALAHGGFTDLIDFEKAIKDGHGANYHDANGYPGMMGGLPKKKVVEEDGDGIPVTKEQVVFEAKITDSSTVVVEEETAPATPTPAVNAAPTPTGDGVTEVVGGEEARPTDEL